MKKILMWIKNNPYKALQNIWMFLITLLLVFVVIQQSNIQSKVSDVEWDISTSSNKRWPRSNSIGSKVSDIESTVSYIGSKVSDIESTVSDVESDISSIKRRLGTY